MCSITQEFMRYKNDFDGINNVLNRLLERYNLQKSLDEIKLFQNWREIVGEKIADHFQPEYIERGTLFLNKIGTKDSRAGAGLPEEIVRVISRAGIKITVKKVKII